MQQVGGESNSMKEAVEIPGSRLLMTALEFIWELRKMEFCEGVHK